MILRTVQVTRKRRFLAGTESFSRDVTREGSNPRKKRERFFTSHARKSLARHKIVRRTRVRTHSYHDIGLVHRDFGFLVLRARITRVASDLCVYVCDCGVSRILDWFFCNTRTENSFDLSPLRLEQRRKFQKCFDRINFDLPNYMYVTHTRD